MTMQHLASILPAALAEIFAKPNLTEPRPWQRVRELWRADDAPRVLWCRQDVLDVTVYQVTDGDTPPIDALGFQHPETIARLAGARLTAPDAGDLS
jgi:hypothetical protein